MLLSLVHLPLNFISGIFIPLGQRTGGLFYLTSLSPLTCLVDLFPAALNGDPVYPPWVNMLVLERLLSCLSGWQSSPGDGTL